MKVNLIYKNLILGCVALFALNSCDTDQLHDLNINPQAVDEIDVNFLFSKAQLGLSDGFGNRYINWRTNVIYMAGAMQQQINPGGTGNNYGHNEESSSAPYRYYDQQLTNHAEVIRQTGPGGYDEGNKVNLRNASRILRAFDLHRLTDYYGAIPYFTANMGLDGEFFPTYDKQSVIYPDLLKELDEAVNTMSASNPDEGFADADMIYGGDISKWKKFGNSIMLRLAMRASNVAPDLANTYVTKAIAGGVFQSNDDNVWIPHAIGPSEWENQNGLSRTYYPGDGGQRSTLGETLVNFLKGADPNTVEDDDPRLMILSGGIAIWTASDWLPVNEDPLAQRGVPHGLGTSSIAALEGKPEIILDSVFSRMNYKMLDDDDPYLIMNHAEVEFLQAEALERGIGSGISGTAKEHYEAGVKSAMQMYTPFDESLTVSDEAVAKYLATYPYGVAKPDPLEMIGDQMWVSKFMNWWDAWSDWRRTGYPKLVEYTESESTVTGGKIYRRLMYPTGEVASNPNFNQSQFNNYTSRVWWDGGTE